MGAPAACAGQTQLPWLTSQIVVGLHASWTPSHAATSQKGAPRVALQYLLAHSALARQLAQTGRFRSVSMGQMQVSFAVSHTEAPHAPAKAAQSNPSQ